jgi:hypothetical protein
MVADARYKSIVGPAGWVSKCRPIFARTSSLTAADCHRFLVFILPYALFGVVDVEVYNVIVELTAAIAEVIARVIRTEELPRMKQRVRRALEEFERVFPQTEHRINLHLFNHLVDVVAVWGPVFATNMFPFERFIGWLKRHVTQRRYPEVSMFNNHARHVSKPAARRVAETVEEQISQMGDSAEVLQEMMGRTDAPMEEYIEGQVRVGGAQSRRMYFTHEDMTAIEKFCLAHGPRDLKTAILAYETMRSATGSATRSWQATDDPDLPQGIRSSLGGIPNGAGIHSLYVSKLCACT